MTLLSLLFGEKKPTAPTAKERLQIILAHERGLDGPRRYDLPALQRELLAVISKYVSIRPEDITMNLEHQDNIDVLAVKIELADNAR